MSASARRILASDRGTARNARPNGGTQGPRRNASEGATRPQDDQALGTKLQVFIAAENRLLREALAHMLAKKDNIEVTEVDLPLALDAECIPPINATVLLLSSRGVLSDDLLAIRQVRAAAPGLRVLLLGMAKNAAEFLQCVRAGISGYLLHDASADEVLAGVRGVYAGEAVCPGTLCMALFRYFESEAASLPCASARRRLGLTRREQQLVPLIAKGLTNKEIASHFSLSEQTVKNHLYRMKHKTGAEDRLDIAQLYRTHGFLI